MNQRPLIVGLLLCEQVVVEERTRNLTLVNCFTQRDVERIPSEVVPFVVFAALSNGRGEMPLDVVIHRLDTLEEVWRVSLKARFANPLQVLRCILRLRDSSFPAAGQYQVSLLVDREPMAQRKFAILKREKST